MTPDFSLRNAALLDLCAVMNIERASFEPDIQETEAVFRRRIELFPEGFVLFTDSAGNTAGYLCSELWSDIPENPADFSVGHDISKMHRADGKILYISSFALLPEYRGCGNGALLFSKGLSFIKKCVQSVQEMVLLVNEQWTGARRIYESYGFTRTAVIPDAFPHSAGIVMQFTSE